MIVTDFQVYIVDHNLILISGGMYLSTYSSKAAIVNASTLLSRRVSSLPSPRFTHACVPVNRCIYVFGGMAIELLSDCLCYDLRTDQWRKLWCLPKPSNFTTAVVYLNQIFVTGCMLDAILVYNLNDYTIAFNIPNGINKQKIIFFSEDRMFLLCGGVIYCCELKVCYNWIKAVDTSVEIDCGTVCPPCQYRNSVYFVRYPNNLYEINLNSRKLSKTAVQLILLYWFTNGRISMKPTNLIIPCIDRYSYKLHIVQGVLSIEMEGKH